MVARNRPDELRLTREYDAPLEIVWEAWTDPEQVAKWWGPRGFTLTTHGKDLRAGGYWKYTMHGPDGVDYENTTIYHEVEPLKKLVYDHGGSEDRPPLFRVTALFSESNGKTTIDMTMHFPSPERAQEIAKFIKQAGGESTWDRLAEYLEKEASGKEKFVIARSFDAPIDVVYKMWTTPEHFAKWLPPTGFTMEFLRADIRPGGCTLWMMTDGATLKMFGRMEYVQAEKPGTIIYTQQFCDEDGNIARHPLAPVWPETMLTTVTLTEEGPDRTRVRVEWEPHGPMTREELAAFIEERAGMTLGWSGSFDKLEALLAERG